MVKLLNNVQLSIARTIANRLSTALSGVVLSLIINKEDMEKIMKKIMATFLMVVLATILNCQPQDINVRSTWGSDSTAQFFKILVVTGSDSTLFPFTQGGSYYDLDPQTYNAEFDVFDTTHVFASSINGELIQLAGALVDQYGLISRLVVTDIKRKPDEPNQMRLLEFNFEF